METPYIIQVDAKGCQRICLADGTPIPAQVESTCYQDVEQARKGECTFSVLCMAITGKPGYDPSTGAIEVVGAFSFKLPDGRICDVDNLIERQLANGGNAAQIVVTAKLKPSA